jgi:hypothetical protein
MGGGGDDQPFFLDFPDRCHTPPVAPPVRRVPG